jgi:Na+/proline symporter
MNIGFFIAGGIIFAIYMALTIYNILYSNRKQREENYPEKNKPKL